jgi:alpha-tubulin suppressor-like RCC1 family protein
VRDALETEIPWRRRTLVLGLAAASCAGVAGTALVLKGPPTKTVQLVRSCLKQLVSGGKYACALLTDGTVHCWGEAIPAVDAAQDQPYRMSVFKRPATSLFAGSGVICTGLADGSLWCVGSNREGRLSQPLSVEYSNEPVEHVLRGVDQLSEWGGCALAEGKLTCWTSPEDARSPQLVTGLPAPVKQLTSGRFFFCVLLENGEVWVRGSNLRGELGMIEAINEEDRAMERLRGRDAFTRLEALGSTVKQITTGITHSCALKQDGSVWCWGQNGRGQIGNGQVSECGSFRDPTGSTPSSESGSRSPRTTRPPSAEDLLSDLAATMPVCRGDAHVPERVQALPADIVSIALGDDVSCAITTRGQLWCWGANSDGIVGAKLKLDWEGPFNVTIPTRAPFSEPVASLDLGSNHACARMRSGGLRCWGELSKWADWEHPNEVALPCP